MGITDYRNVHFECLSYSKPDKRDQKLYSQINYNGSFFFIQSPKLKCIGSTPDTINLEFSKEHPDFYSLFKKLDMEHINVCCQNSQKWFKGKQFSSDKIQKAYKSDILPGNTQSSLPYLNLNLNSETTVFDEDKNKLSVDEYTSLLNDNVLLKVILHLDGLSVSKHSIGCTWHVKQIKIYKPKDSEPNQEQETKKNVFEQDCFGDSESEEDNSVDFPPESD